MEFEEQMEELKQLKANQNGVSFADIEKNRFKFKKELSLPPITGSNASVHASTKHRPGPPELSENSLQPL